MPPLPTATVAVKSAWLSKINWIQAIGGLTAILNEFLPIVPVNDQHYVTGAVVLLTAISTFVARTFYTTSITPSAVAKV